MCRCIWLPPQSADGVLASPVPPITTLSISRARPTRAATATSTGRPLKLAHGVEVLGVARLEVLGLDPGRGELAAGRGERRGGVGLARQPRRSAALRRAAQRRRALALRRAQVGVARAHREPVGLAHGRHDLDLDREVEVARPSARITTACWASFWPKKATSGPTVLNSFATTVVTPRKCSGPRRCGSPSSTSVSAPPTSTVGREAVRVDLVDGRARRRGRRPRPRRASRSRSSSRG